MTRSAVAVIDDVMAKRLWPDEDPIGRRFRLADTEQARRIRPSGSRSSASRRRFAGPTSTIAVRPCPAAFVPYPYAPTPNTGLTVARRQPRGRGSAVREAIRASDPGLAVFNVRPMDDVRLLIYWQYQLFGIMFGVFGGVALFLAAIGVYGVLSFAVSQRTQEIGLRMALGAERERVLRMVVRQGLTLASFGVVFGLLGAFGVTRVIRTLLYRVTPTDPVSFLGVAASSSSSLFSPVICRRVGRRRSTRRGAEE